MADAVSDISVQTVPMRIRRDTVWSHAVSDISVQTVPMHAQNVLPSCFLISLLLLFSPPFLRRLPCEVFRNPRGSKKSRRNPSVDFA